MILRLLLLIVYMFIMFFIKAPEGCHEVSRSFRRSHLAPRVTSSV